MKKTWIVFPNLIQTSATLPDSSIMTPLAPPSRPVPLGSFDIQIIGHREQGSISLRPVAISPAPQIQTQADSHSYLPAIKHPVTLETRIADHPQSSPRSFQANVIGLTQNNLPVLNILWPGQTESNPYLLQFPTSALPPGTQLEILPVTLPTATAPQPSMHGPVPASMMPTIPFDLLSSTQWPVFDDALDILTAQSASSHMAASQSSLAKIMPNPGNPAQMGSAILFSMAAIRSGDISSWMGEKTIAALKRDGARIDILGRLQKDFSGLSKMMTEPISQDWRGVAIPMMWQNDLQKINLYYRHQEAEKDEPTDKPGDKMTRFIFDLTLDRLGPVQLDGLMKKNRLDLILRTQTPFSRSMQATMRKKYLEVLDHGQLGGDLAFQTRHDQWVKVDIRAQQLRASV